MVKKPVTNNVVEGGDRERERERQRERERGEGRPTLFQSKFSTSQLSWQI